MVGTTSKGSQKGPFASVTEKFLKKKNYKVEILILKNKMDSYSVVFNISVSTGIVKYLLNINKCASQISRKLRNINH